jgi:hypothetical protein
MKAATEMNGNREHVAAGFRVTRNARMDDRRVIGAARGRRAVLSASNQKYRKQPHGQ